MALGISRLVLSACLISLKSAFQGLKNAMKYRLCHPTSALFKEKVYQTFLFYAVIKAQVT
jgi:hypothetical protein